MVTKKLLTMYSDSHEVLYTTYFKPSFDKHLSRQYDLLAKKTQQISLTGDYGTEAFCETTQEKIKWIIENLDVNDSEEIIFSDCDIQFFDNLAYSIGKNDILFQRDFEVFCTGFMVLKQNTKVLDFFESVLKSMQKNNNLNDQDVVNILLKDEKKLKFDMLPTEKYWTMGNFNEGKTWNGGAFLVPSGKIILHHANFIVGVKNKFLALEEVKKSQESEML